MLLTWMLVVSLFTDSFFSFLAVLNLYLNLIYSTVLITYFDLRATPDPKHHNTNSSPHYHRILASKHQTPSSITSPPKTKLITHRHVTTSVFDDKPSKTKNRTLQRRCFSKSKETTTSKPSSEQRKHHIKLTKK
jgi:hypothetical protein